MYKKILCTGIIGLGLLAGLTACGKKDSDSESTAGKNDSVFAATSQSAPKLELGADVNSDQADAVLQIVKQKIPQLNIEKLEKAPVPGFFQAMAGGDVLYISANGDYVFAGDLFSLKGSDNFQLSPAFSLTEDLRKQARMSYINSIPESDMVVYTPESGKTDYTITVFTDIDCGYCRKFHSELKDYLAQNIKVRYLAFPRAGKGSDSYNKAKTVWCAKDRNKAMDEAKLTNDFKATDKLCNTDAIDKSIDLFRQIGFRGTPSMVLDDGSLSPGYLPADRLKAILDSNRNAKLSSTNNSQAVN